MTNHHVYEELISITAEENVMVNEPLRDHTYTRLGGAADLLVTPETYEQVRQIVKLANKKIFRLHY